MKPSLTLRKPPWMLDENTQRVMRLLNQEVSEPLALFVGGCVRNWILQKPGHDIDIATKLLPDEVVKILTGAGIKVIPTGIDHGTVMAVLNGKSFEITTLRRDDETDGRRAIVSFTDDWLEDVKRRDFTMNALLADMDGNIYDLLECGIEDAKAGRVVFVGEAPTRIKEDYLRILRLFRFYAFYGKEEIEESALNACREVSPQLSTLSRERITQECLKILSVDDLTAVLKVMFDHNVLSDFADKNYHAETLRSLCALQTKHKAYNVEARLFVLGGCQPKLFEEMMRLSHVQKNFIIKLQITNNLALYSDEKALKRAIYYHGNDLMVQGYLLGIATGKVDENLEMIDFSQNWQAPKCPITGDALLKEGFVTGPDLGQELKRREEEWLEDVV